MTVAVRYHSRGGNTKKMAEAIAKAAGVEAMSCDVPVDGDVDLLFLGSAVYAFTIDEHTKNFIGQLRTETIKNVALFSTSAGVKKGITEMEELLADKGIRVLDRNFHCWGAFSFMRRGHPNDSDLKQAGEFALAAMEDCKESSR